MMCMTVLHGGVCHRTSSPHKRGNKMKEKKRRDGEEYGKLGGKTRANESMWLKKPEGERIGQDKLEE